MGLFQTSSNLIDWVTLFSATNNGSLWTFANYNPSSSQRFYRVVPIQSEWKDEDENEDEDEDD